jgi:hypothetical protein
MAKVRNNQVIYIVKIYANLLWNSSIVIKKIVAAERNLYSASILIEITNLSLLLKLEL